MKAKAFAIGAFAGLALEVLMGSTSPFGGTVPTTSVTGTSSATTFTSTQADGGAAFIVPTGQKLCLGSTCASYIDAPNGATNTTITTNGWAFITSGQMIATAGVSGSTGNPTLTNNAGVPLRISTSNALLLLSTSGSTKVGDGTGDEGDGILVSGEHAFTAKSLPTCAAGKEWTVAADVLSGVATGKRSKICLCTSDGASAYKWQNLATATLGTTTTCGTE